LRWPARPWMPIETGRPSVKARAGSWQVAQATVPSADNRPSKKSFSPRAIFPGVCGLSGGMVARVWAAGTPVCCKDLGWAKGPGLGIGGGLPAEEAGVTTEVIPKVKITAFIRNHAKAIVRFCIIACCGHGGPLSLAGASNLSLCVCALSYHQWLFPQVEALLSFGIHILWGISVHIRPKNDMELLQYCTAGFLHCVGNAPVKFTWNNS